MASLPPPPKATPSAQAQTPIATNGKQFAVTSGRVSGAQRVVIYGPGGIGKSSLARLAPNPVFLDVEMGTREFDVRRVPIESFADLRACLQSDVLDPFASIVIDTATKAEQMAVAHTLATVPSEKGQSVTSVEGYGYGKGYQHVDDTFRLLLMDLDRQIRAGRNVILIAHDCVNDVPNPMGENFIRFEPHLQSPKSGKASIRNAVVQWADHVLFLGYDVISKDGKGRGSGTRTIWPVERPDHIAKSRSMGEPMEFVNADDGSIWPLILGGAK